jgi:CHAD domain-containing protein
VTDPQTHREVERKFIVHDDFSLPDVSDVSGVTRVMQRPAFDMEATYYDTSDLALFRWGITFRRRIGGSDAGWHMKLPVRAATEGVRDEIHMPDAASIPAALVDIISPLLMGRSLQPLVVVHTRRNPIDIDGPDAKVELVDDHVHVKKGDLVTGFREIEIEMMSSTAATVQLMDELSRKLKSAGAQPSSTSKAARALGARTRDAADVDIPTAPKRNGLAADAVRTFISRDVRQLLLADVDVRRNLPDSVHQMRVAARRLRSTLRTFSALFDVEWAEGVRMDLAWIASELGNIRDTEVLHERLLAHCEHLTEPHRHEVSTYLDSFFRQRQDDARASALAALRSDRHDFLIEDLVKATREPRLSDEAFMPCSDALIPALDKSWQALRKSMKKVDSDSATWHRARIKAKQTRYAAEALAPIFGKQMRIFAKQLSQLTDVLGLHQDATVAQEQLRAIAVDAPSHIAFALGELSQFELAMAQHDQEDVRRLWPALERTAHKVLG